MNSKKVVLGIVLFVTVVVFTVAAPTALAETITVTGDSAAKPGDNVDYSVSLESGEQLCAIQFAVRYDPDTLTLTSADTGSIFSGVTPPTINSAIPGTVYLAWDSLAPISGNGIALTLSFTVTGAMEQGTRVEIDAFEDTVLFTADGEELDTTFVSAETVPGETKSSDSGPPSGGAVSGSNSGLTLSRNELRLALGESASLAVNETDRGALVWTSSNESVAVVDNGLITSLADGRAVITVQTEDGTSYATCALTVGDKNTLIWVITAAVAVTAAVLALILIGINKKKKMNAIKKRRTMGKKRVFPCRFTDIKITTLQTISSGCDGFRPYAIWLVGFVR